ncbi:MAG TPA: TonB-dependent receptor [Longimicrobiales bacterium]|nr:TonB-dependent receptor [Longimicrobiales bacterium]
MSISRFGGALSCALLVILSLGAGPALAGGGAPDRGEIRGRVVDTQTGEPLEGVQVVARGAEGAVVAGALTAADGAYVVGKLPAGTYTVEAVRLGYEKASVQGVVVPEGGAVTVDLRLGVVALQAEALVVSGRRQAERVVDADASVAVVQGEQLGRKQEPSVFGALKGTKGVDVFEAGLGQQQVNSRGFVNPFTSNMLILVDNRLASMPGLQNMLSGLVTAAQGDVAQVEVVTGPSSALYGANAANGVVSIATRDPREWSGQSLSITGGQRGMLRLSGRSAGPIGPRVAYKLAGESFQARDFERYNTFTQNGASLRDVPDFDVEHRTVSGALYYYPSAGSRLVYDAGYTRASYVNLTVVSRLQLHDWDVWYHQLRGNFPNVLGGSLFAQAYYTKNDAGDSYYLDIFTRGLLPQAPGGQPLPRDTAMSRARFIDRGDRFDAEAQYTLKAAAGNAFTAGAQWRRSRPNSEGTYLTDGPNGEPIRIDETGAYLAYDNTMVPDVRLTVIGRYDDHSDFGGRFSPKLGLTYTRGDHTLRATYNRAFNSPVTYLLYAQSFVGRKGTLPIFVRGNRGGYAFVNLNGGRVPEALKPLEALDVESFEAGYRGVFGGRLSVDVTGYRSTYWNYISKEVEVSKPDSGIFVVGPATGQPLREVTRTYVNYGELPVLGAELATQLLVSERLSASGSFSYQEPRTFRKALYGLPEPGFNAPARKYTGSLAYRGWWRPESYLEVGAVHVGAFYFQQNLPYLQGDVPAYTTVDLAAGVPLPAIRGARSRIGLAVKNALDEKHFETPGGAVLRRLVSVTLATEW